MNQTNVFGEPIEECCSNPITGYFRDGFCRTSKYDQGSHTVCALVTQEFLDFSLSRGNDLSTPRPEFQFPGLIEGLQSIQEIEILDAELINHYPEKGKNLEIPE